MHYLSQIFIEITLIATGFLMTIGLIPQSEEHIVPPPVTIEVSTSTISATTPEFTIPEKDVYNEVTKNPPVNSQTVPPVFVVPVFIPQSPTPTPPQTVYTEPMPEPESCVEEVEITQFSIGIGTREDFPKRGETSTLFTPNVRVTAKCTDTLDFEIKTNIPQTGLNEAGEAELYSLTRKVTTTIKDSNGYYLSLVEGLGHTTTQGTFEFEVTVKKDGEVLGTKKATVIL